ncbi:acyl-CoA dehydrogenase family protein [Saccharopolyspora sp. CA-218241]|uniref:acyl-CoA dehydrogenase family protein n=1 Tax=Saccharopolyspora sp. CA-218241 TaxID=3240027 RepID=UPI003D9972C2
MDFALDEEWATAAELAREIFADHATAERLRAVEERPDRIDEALWAQLGRAGLLGSVLDEDVGGAGLGLGGLCALLREQGRAVAPVPLWPSAVAALAVARWGADRQRAALLPGVADGSVRLTAALEEFGPAPPAAPACAAEEDGSRWRLTGEKAVVPAPFGADRVLVSATTGRGPGLFLIAAGGAGIGWQRCETTDRDVAGHLRLDGASAEAVGAPGGGAPAEVLRWASVALSALQLGVAEGALDRAAGYVREREQFGRPLGSLQAVQHQLADCYVEVDALRVAVWRAVSAVVAGERAVEAVLVAKWWAGHGGLNVVHRVQHVHGGIGVDIDYPVHRYFLRGKQLAGTLGGPSAVLAELGDVLVGGRAR